MTEALRMLDMPKDIPEDCNGGAEAPAKVKPGEFADDVAIADLGGESIMDEDPTVNSCWRTRSGRRRIRMRFRRRVR